MKSKTFKGDWQEVLTVHCLLGGSKFVSFVDREPGTKRYVFHPFQEDEITFRIDLSGMR